MFCGGDDGLIVEFVQVL